jgi:hypothetical protein
MSNPFSVKFTGQQQKQKNKGQNTFSGPNPTAWNQQQQQNQQNQQNKNQNQQNQQKQIPKSWWAIFPYPPHVPSFILRLHSRFPTSIIDEQAVRPSLSSPFQLLFVELPAFTDGHKKKSSDLEMAQLCGQETHYGTLLCSHCDLRNLGDIIQFADMILRHDAIQGRFLDLSNLSRRGLNLDKPETSGPTARFPAEKILNLNRDPGTLGLLLLLCAIRCRDSGIEVISLNSNHINDIFINGVSILANVEKLFPDLKQITFYDNPFNASQMYEDTAIQILTDESPGLRTTAQDFPENRQSKPTFLRPKPPAQLPPVQNVEVAGERFGHLFGRPPPDQTLPPPIQVDGSVPLHQFIHEFLNAPCAELAKFYHPRAVFSVTVDLCSPGSPLAFYQQFSRNLLTENRPFVVGADAVAAANRQLFDPAFSSAVSAIHGTVGENGRCPVVLHGSFEDRFGNVLGFDRSMCVAGSAEAMAITNDHIFIRAGSP